MVAFFKQINVCVLQDGLDLNVKQVIIYIYI